MTRVALLVGLCLLHAAPLQASEPSCPAYRPEPSIPLVNPPAALSHGFLLASDIGNYPNTTAVMLHIDDEGRLLWVRQFAGEASLSDLSVAAGDGTVLLAEEARTAASTGPAIVKLQSDGSAAWSKRIDDAKAMIWGFDGAPDGGAYAALWSGVAEQAKSRVGFILHLTAGGEIAWARTIAADGNAVIQPVVTAQADGVLIAKTWPIAYAQPSAILLVRLAGDGTLAWARLIGAPDRDLGVSSMLVLHDGSIAIAGNAGGTADDSSDSAFIHLDPGGMPISAVALHAPPLGNLRLLSREADGQLLLGGTTAQGGPALADPVGPNRPTIAQISLDGEIAWARAQDVGPRGGMLFGLASGPSHIIAVATSGDWGPAVLLRLNADGEPDGDGWAAARVVQIGTRRMDLTTARIDVELRPFSARATDAGLTTSDASITLVLLCSR